MNDWSCYEKIIGDECRVGIKSIILDRLIFNASIGGLKLAVICISLYHRLEVYVCREHLKPPWDRLESEYRQRIGPLTEFWCTPGFRRPRDKAQLVMEAEQINQ